MINIAHHSILNFQYLACKKKARQGGEVDKKDKPKMRQGGSVGGKMKRKKTSTKK